MAWQANIPVFNEYKPVTYMYQYFSKTEDHCSLATKQAAKEALKTITKAYLSNRECSVQESV